MRKLYLDDPVIGKLEKFFLNRALNSNYVSSAGPLVSEFENRIAKYLRIKAAVSTQSGTAAIHMALYELGIRKGDEVIVPALTFVATVNPIMYVGATPVFADVDLRTWNIDPREIEKKITAKTKAIMPVHCYGNPCDMAAILKIAKEYGLHVIEDATESLGATYQGRYAGTLGTLGCLSFNGNKIITTGGGGMVVGKDKARLDHIKFLINQARDKSSDYFHSEIGFNYRMTNIEAALGLAQIEQIYELLRRKKELNSIYNEKLKAVPGVHFQEEHERATSSWWLTCIIFRNKANVPALQKRLQKKGIITRRIFMPITEFPPYKVFKKGRYQNSYYIYENGLCLPSSTLNSKGNIHRICDSLKACL